MTTPSMVTPVAPMLKTLLLAAPSIVVALAFPGCCALPWMVTGLVIESAVPPNVIVPKPGAKLIVGTGDVCAFATAIAERSEQCAELVGGWVVHGVVDVVSVAASTVIVEKLVAAATGVAVKAIAGSA